MKAIIHAAIAVALLSGGMTLGADLARVTRTKFGI